VLTCERIAEVFGVRAGLVLAGLLAAVPVGLAVALPGAIYRLVRADRTVVELATSATLLAVAGMIPLLAAHNVAAALRAGGDNLGWGLPGSSPRGWGFVPVLLAMVYRV
jgi:Na+-driven multidrug efflux pump